jgi:peptidyl-tRNA hydrolase, PTH1 family
VKLFVGLGNPGEKHARNRHNVGFMAVDAIAGSRDFTPWRGKFTGALSEGRLGTEKILLLKPGTYMNRSGDSVQAATSFYKIGPEDIVVFHDELDLGPGKIRVKSGGGHAGHNGLRSITAHLGPEFQRVRIGIGHPGNKKLVTNYVLGDFAKFESDWLEPLLEGIAEGADALASGDAPGFLNAVSRKFAPAGTPQRKMKPEAPAPLLLTKEGSAPDHRSMLQKLAEKFR